MATSRLQRLREAFETFFHQITFSDEELGRRATERRWLPRSRFWRDFQLNFTIGLVLAIALHLLPGWGWLTTKQDQTMDWMVRVQSGISPEGYRGRPFVFLEIDEPVYREWGEPFHVPRDGLATLIDFAVSGGASLVMVDVDLSRSAGPEDESIERLLRGLAKKNDDAESHRTQVLLARTFREPHPPGASEWREVRSSFLDPIVEQAPDVHWASTLFIRESDFRIRRFRNFEPTCNGGTPDVVPAMQLLAAALILDPANGVSTLDNAMREHLPECGAPSKTERPNQSVRFSDVEIALQGDRISSRILYNFGGNSGDVPRVPHGGRQARLLTRLPAKAVLDSRAAIDPKIVRGRIVVIGASYADSRDLHLTPLGEMPGSLILANAIYSLLQHGGLKPPSLLVIGAAQLVLLAIVSLVFAPVSFYWAAVLATPVVILVLLPLSFVFFQHGVWLDFAIPLGAVQAQAIIKKYIERYSRMRVRLNTLAGGTSEAEGSDAECDTETRGGEEPESEEPPAAAEGH